jgi:hypothetical protein
MLSDPVSPVTEHMTDRLAGEAGTGNKGQAPGFNSPDENLFDLGEG